MASSSLERALLIEAVEELAARRLDALNLYRPLPNQLAFHCDRRRERLLIGSNRGGKTSGACAEIAMIFTGVVPDSVAKHTGIKPTRNRTALGYPRRDGKMLIVGKDERHNGSVLWHKLAHAGAFKIICDTRTKPPTWRVFNENDPWDRRNESKAKLSPPFIPQRYIREIAWAEKKMNAPSKVLGVNGWEMIFASSLSSPFQGDAYDVVCFDEEILNERWYSECAVRGLLDKKGRFFWSATPQVGTDLLTRLHERAERGDEHIAEYQLKIADNPYISEDSKKRLRESLEESEVAVRYDGEFASKGFRVYPEFKPDGIHGCSAFPVPHDWTRYMVVDPGRQVAAVLFAAVPPHDDENWAGTIHIYDELYIRNATAAMVARAINEKMANYVFRTWIIDWRGARKAQEGTGRTIEHHYLEEIRKFNLSSETTGCGFIAGSDDIRGREEAVRSLLSIGPDGKSRLIVHKEKVPNLIWEMGKRRYATDRIGRIIVGNRGVPKRIDRDDHLCDCLEMLSAYDPQYHPPITRTKKVSAVYKMFLDHMKSEREKRRREGKHSAIRLGRGLR